MAARRRLADTLLLNWIVTLSLLLILLGLVMFVVFLTDPVANRWSEAGRLIGATLFQVGAVTLILELVHLERLLGVKVPEALLDHGYLDTLKDDRLDELIERAIRARFIGMNADDARLGRDWLLQLLSAPSRRDYTVTLELKRDDPLTEPFPDADPGPRDGVLCVQITYEYVTDVNATAKPVLINGNGVVQAYRNTVPDTLTFARRFRAGELTPAEEREWVEKVAQPRIELRPGSATTPVVVPAQIDNLVVTSDEGRLLLAFDVRCDHLVLPGERVKVTYRHREYVDRRGYFPWRATALTYNLRVKTKGFEGFDTYPIPAPSLPSEDDKLEVLPDGIYYRGVLYPNSTFTFFWTERAASGQQQPATDGR